MKECGQYIIDVIEAEDLIGDPYGDVIVITDRNNYLLSIENEGIFAVVTQIKNFDGDGEKKQFVHIVGIDGE